MFRYLPVRRIFARQVLDSRGNPTVEVEATVGEGIVGMEGHTAIASETVRRIYRKVCSCRSPA